MRPPCVSAIKITNGKNKKKLFYTPPRKKSICPPPENIFLFSPLVILIALTQGGLPVWLLIVSKQCGKEDKEQEHWPLHRAAGKY